MSQDAPAPRPRRAGEIRDKLWRGHDPYAGFPWRLIAVDRQGWNSDHPYLTELIETRRPAVVVELGVWKGGSTLTMAGRMKALGLDACVIAVDTWLGGWDHWLQEEWFRELSFDHGYPRLFDKFLANVVDAELEDFVIPLPLDSVNAFHVLRGLDILIDAIHIDGGHDYETVSSDLRHWWRLLKPGGMLVMDDYFDDGKTWAEVGRAVDDFLANTPHSQFEFTHGKCRTIKEPAVAGAAIPNKPQSAAVPVPFELIDVCMILHNEEQFIESCLRPLIPHFRHFTIVDMQSTDRTREIVLDLLGQKVRLLHYTPADLVRRGYAQARNLTIISSGSPWLLHIDADEMVVAGLDAGCIQFAGPPPPVGFVERRNLAPPENGSAPGGGARIRSTEFHCRLHQRHDDVRWRGYIHEEIWVGDKPGFGQGPKIGITIDHHSEFRPEHERHRKFQRYSWMLLNGFANPGLREGTNKYWYETFVPSRMAELVHAARGFAEREGLSMPGAGAWRAASA